MIFRSIEQSRAVVEPYLLLTAVDDGKLRVVSTGSYRDEMVTENGAWLIQHKTFKLDNAF